MYKFYNEKIIETEQVVNLNNKIHNLEETVDNLSNSTNLTTSNNMVNSVEDQKINTEMSIELAYGILNKYKAEKLSDANWYIKNVKLIAHGDDNTYWVAYEYYNLDDGHTDSAGAIIEYKNGEWTTSLPGFSGIDEEYIKEKNFINY